VQMAAHVDVNSYKGPRLLSHVPEKIFYKDDDSVFFKMGVSDTWTTYVRPNNVLDLRKAMEKAPEGTLNIAEMQGGVVSRDVGGWTGRLDVRGMDNVGFVRMRKAGTTSVHHHLEQVLQLCVPRCVDRRTLCHNCLYGGPDCTCKGPSPRRRYNFEGCYPCNHMSPWTIQENFRAFVAKSLSGKSTWMPKYTVEQSRQRPPQLHMFTVIRNPFDRLLSEFFFILPACNPPRNGSMQALEVWVKSYPIPVRNALCAGDFETFATHPQSNAANQQTRMLAAKFYTFDQAKLKHEALGLKHFQTAIRNLRRMRLVLVQERLFPEGMALLDFTFGGGGVHRNQTFEQLRMRPSAQVLRGFSRVGQHDEKRAALQSNETLRKLVLKANRFDQALHREAEHIFQGCLNKLQAGRAS